MGLVNNYKNYGLELKKDQRAVCIYVYRYRQA